MDFQRLQDLTEQDFSEILASKPVFLVGSFISTFSPTNLPSGQHICSEFFDLIFGSAEPKLRQKWPGWLKKDFDLIPFEALGVRPRSNSFSGCTPSGGLALLDIQSICSKRRAVDATKKVHSLSAESSL